MGDNPGSGSYQPELPHFDDLMTNAESGVHKDGTMDEAREDSDKAQEVS